MRLPVLFAAMLLNLTAYAGSDPPPAGALPSCPQASSSIEVSTSPDVAGMNVGTNQVLSGAELDALSELGVGWSRITVRWSDVQRTSTGTPDWAGLDANVKALKSRGINVLATVNSTPKWAFAAGTLANCKRVGRPALKPEALGGTEQGCIDLQVCLASPSCSGGPQVPQTRFWKTFVRELVDRYNGFTEDPLNPGQTLPRIDAFEIWNEPDAGREKFNGSLRQYHDLVLAPAVEKVRLESANQGAVLVGGALAAGDYHSPDPATLSAAVSVALQDALVGSAAQAVDVDAVSMHSYKFPQNTLAVGVAFRQTMLSLYGGVSKPLWLTEYGKDSSTGCSPVDATCAEADQYCMYRDFQGRNFGPQAVPVFDKAFWYALSDFMTPQATVSQGFGVLGECTVCASPCNYEFFTKPVFSAMQQVLGKTPSPARTVFGVPPQ
jgi:hypothetical protein